MSLRGVLCVQCLLDCPGQVDGLALAPVVQEHVPGALVRHVLVDRDDVDPIAAHGLQHRRPIVTFTMPSLLCALVPRIASIGAAEMLLGVGMSPAKLLAGVGWAARTCATRS